LGFRSIKAHREATKQSEGASNHSWDYSVRAGRSLWRVVCWVHLIEIEHGFEVDYSD